MRSRYVAASQLSRSELQQSIRFTRQAEVVLCRVAWLNWKWCQNNQVKCGSIDGDGVYRKSCPGVRFGDGLSRHADYSKVFTFPKERAF